MNINLMPTPFMDALDLSTCGYLKTVYTRLAKGSLKLTDNEKGEALHVLKKVSDCALNAMFTSYDGFKPTLSDYTWDLESLIREPEPLKGAIQKAFIDAFEILLPEEQDFIQSRCGFHKNAPHTDENINKIISGFCDLLIRRYIKQLDRELFPESHRSAPEMNQKIERLSSKGNSLVTEFASHALKDPDIWRSEFFNFLEPNEKNPQEIKKHLADMKEGLIVSVGAERSLFNLLFAPKECEGVVVVDKSSSVKAYNDFNLLLIRLSSNPQEYALLSKPLKIQERNGEKFKRRMSLIKNRLNAASFSTFEKNYYKRNLCSFGAVFLNEKRLWREEKIKGKSMEKEPLNSFDTCRYDLNSAQFDKIKRYAEAGKIISVVGDINDLTFLREKMISVVDISNVAYYTFINIKGVQDHTKVIWTSRIQTNQGLTFMYFSYRHDEQKINEEEVKELNNLFNSYINKSNGQVKSLLDLKNAMLKEYCEFLSNRMPSLDEQQKFKVSLSQPIGSFYSRSSLEFLRFLKKSYSQKIN